MRMVMLKIYLCLFFSFFIVLAHAQSGNSFYHLLKSSQADTVQVNNLLKAASQLSESRKDSSSFYLDAAIALSEKLNYSLGLMKGYVAKGEILVYKDKKQSLDFFLAAYGYAKELKLSGYESKLLNYIGNQHYMLGEYIKAEDYYRKALAIDKAQKNHSGVARIYTNLGMTYIKLTDYSRAFEVLNLSTRLADSLGLKEIAGGNYIDIANLMGLQKKYNEALLYYEKAATLFALDKNPEMVNYSNIGKGEIYMQKGSYQQAIDVFNRIEKSIGGQPHKQFDLYQDLGMSYMAIKKFREAERNLIKAQQINDRVTQTPSYSVRNYIGLAQLYQYIGQYEKGIDIAHKAEMLAKQQGALMYSKECFRVLSALYESNGELGKSLRYQRRFSALQDSLAQRDQSEKLAEAETKFRLSEKERELTLLSKENEVQKVRERFNNVLMVALACVLLVVVVATVLLMRAYQKSKAKTQLLARQKLEIEKANALIMEQSTTLREVDKMKSRFFANISHELRTPATLISGMLELMAEGSMSEKEKARVQTALGNSRKLNAIVEEMLDLTRLEAGKVELKKKKVQVHSLLNRITKPFDSLLQKNKIRFINDIEALPVYADLDEMYFEKIINNLIYNAIKFTEDGGWMRVSTHLSQDKNRIEIQISDSGSGIATEDLPHIFERFYQSHSGAQKHDVRGTGIGLSLVKEFTELHGGEVSVSSSIGKGSIFSVSFPCDTLHEEAAEKDNGLTSFSWTQFEKPPTVLLVEDHEEMRGYVSDVLGDRFKIEQTGDGVQALQWLKINSADLIISDVMMPRMDGYTFLGHLKSNERLSHIPVVMLTARAAEEDKLQGLRLGVDDYLIKPFNATELRIRVQNLLHNKTARNEWQQKMYEPEEKVPPAQLSNQAFMAQVIAFVESRIEDRSIEIAALADHLSLSERQLYRKAGELTGMAPAQLIKEVRLKKAWQLLIDRKVSKLTVLASAVGYESAPYFAKQFEARFGKKPSEMM